MIHKNQFLGALRLSFFLVATLPFVASAATVSIDQASLAASTAQPVISGTVDGVSGLTVLIGSIGGGENDIAILDSSYGGVSLTGNTWVTTPGRMLLTPGMSYIVHVYDHNQYGGKQNLLASGTLSVSPDAKCGGCGNAPFISAILPSSGPVGTTVTLVGKNFVQGMMLSGSVIWSPSAYTVGNDGTALVFTVPSTAIQTACSGGCPPPQPTPILPGGYWLNVSNGSSGESNTVKFTVTASQTEPAKCLPVWSCSQWSACSANGAQTRSCTDANTCSVTTNKPAETRSCVPPTNPTTSDPVNALQTQINTLLAQIQSLRTQVQNTNGTPTSVRCPNVSRNLSRGARGNDVVQLQLFLEKTFNLEEGTIATGFFGPMTASYVTQFQSMNGVSPASGTVGPLTRGVIQRVCAYSN